MTHQQYAEGLIRRIAVFAQHLVNISRFKVKHVAKVGALGARFHCDFAHSFVVQHRCKYDIYDIFVQS